MLLNILRHLLIDGMWDCFFHIFSTRDREITEAGMSNGKLMAYRSKTVSSKFGVDKFLVFSEILAHSFNSFILNYANRDFQPY